MVMNNHDHHDDVDQWMTLIFIKNMYRQWEIDFQWQTHANGYVKPK